MAISGGTKISVDKAASLAISGVHGNNPDSYPQSIAVRGGYLWVGQCVEPVSGDIVITRCDLAGNLLDSMRFNNYGHGIAFGVEIDGNSFWIWIECAPVAETNDKGNTEAWGSAIARIKWNPASSPVGKQAGMVPPSPTGAVAKHYSCTVADGHLIVRCIQNDAYYAVYDLGKATNGQFTNLLNNYYKEPAGITTGDYKSNQGFTVSGKYLYILSGTGKPGSNAWVTISDLNSTGLIDRSHKDLDPDLDPREPEGIAFDDARNRLLFGLTNKSDAGNPRLRVYEIDA